MFEYEIKIDSYPVHVNDVKKIERENNLNINVFSLVEQDNTLEPLHQSKNYEDEKVINILH
jgi:hypothetical protein